MICKTIGSSINDLILSTEDEIRELNDQIAATKNEIVRLQTTNDCRKEKIEMLESFRSKLNTIKVNHSIEN